MADLMQGLLQGMQSPGFGMGVGILSGNGLGQGLQQGLLNMQVMQEQQARQDMATRMMTQRVEEFRAKRLAEERKQQEQQAISAMYPGVLPGMTVPGKMTQAQAMGLVPGTQPYTDFMQKPSMEINMPGQRASSTWSTEDKKAAGIPVDNVVVDGPSGPKILVSGKDEGAAYTKLEAAETALSAYEAGLKETGTEFLPTEGKLKTGGLHKNLLLEMKELYNLGVLNGPDLDIMEQVLTDPTSFFSQGYSGQDLQVQIDAIVKPKLKAARERLDAQYGGSESSPTEPAEPEPVDPIEVKRRRLQELREKARQ